MIKVIKLGFVNVFLLIGDDGYVLVDTGMKGSWQKIQPAIEEQGLTLDALKLIVLTHAHQDHIGGLEELLVHVDVPVMMSRIEYEMLLDHSDDAKPITTFGKIIYNTISKAARTKEQTTISIPEFLVDQSYDLTAFGVMAEVVLTPGHTKGSLSIITSTGEAIVGDSLMAMVPWQGPGKPMLASDMNSVKSSMEQLLSIGTQQFYLSHGGKYTRQRFRGALERL